MTAASGAVVTTTWAIMPSWILQPIAALPGCSKLTDANVEKVKEQMTKAEVLELLGPPTSQSEATLLGVSFVVHQMGSVIGAWGGGMIFDLFGNYDLAWRFGVSVGIVAGLVQILFGGPSGTWSSTRPAPAAS